VLLGDPFGSGQSCDRAGHARDACAAASRQRQTLDRLVEELASRARSRQRPRPDALARSDYPCPHRLRRFARPAAELGGARARHVDDQIEAVDERAGELLPEGGELLT
jgi:hypothetical protein